MTGDGRDTQTLLTYGKSGGQHRWRAEWDLVRDVPAGTYRFRVSGFATSAPGQRAPYSVTSMPFSVAPATSLGASAAGSVVRVSYPAAVAAANFRFRPGAPDGG